jgi:hypothetical protein
VLPEKSREKSRPTLVNKRSTSQLLHQITKRAKISKLYLSPEIIENLFEDRITFSFGWRFLLISVPK